MSDQEEVVVGAQPGEIIAEEEPVAVEDPGFVADELAGVERAAALEENLGQVAEKVKDENEMTVLLRIESKLDQLLTKASGWTSYPGGLT